jgi:uncharacterized protein YigE (DUF2233 family)
METEYPYRLPPQQVPCQHGLWAIVLITSLALLLFVFLGTPREKKGSEYSNRSFSWQEVAAGFSVGRYELGSETKLLKSEVLLVRIDPVKYSIQAVLASEIGLPITDLRTLTLAAKGFAGINSHFFDQSGKPLGLLVRNGKKLNKMHRGGKLLTGVFLLKDNKPSIVSRDSFAEKEAQLALQAGPIVIVNGEAVRLKVPVSSSRRSGVAVTKQGEVILYATLLRFPGASLQQIQQMLLDPALDVKDALNLDGGGSSQLFIKKNKALADDTLISGGDPVPVGLIVKER